MNTEQELTVLENELRALKAMHPVAASMLRFYTTTSEIFTLNGGSIYRIQFTPTPNPGGTVFIKLRAVRTDGFIMIQATEPQDGTGNVVVRVETGPSLSKIWSFRVIATGSAPGTFTML